MGKQSRTIIFDDLGDPKLSFWQKLAKKAAAKNQVTFDIDVILQTAQEATGLSDFGPEDFMEPLQVLIDEYDADTDMSGLGRGQMFADLVRCASNRLLIFYRLKTIQGFANYDLKPPISVSGLPRSGTTHLVNLLGADTRLQSLPLWRIQEPFLVPGKEKASNGLKSGAWALRTLLNSDDTAHDDPRYLRCSLRWSGMQITGPDLAAMHPMNPDHIHEELELMTYDFGCNQFEWTSVTPKYRDYYYAKDQTQHYEFMVKVLKLMAIEEGSHRPYVLKCVQNPEQLPALKKVLPQATAVMTHRDPVAIIQSTCTMLAYGHRILRDKVEPRKVLDYWTDRFEHMLRAFVRDRHVFGAEQSIDVLFHEYMADQIGTVEKIYERHDLEFTPTARAQLEAYIQNHPREKYGRVIYKLKEHFGVSPEELRERFQFYFDAFPIKAEV